MTEEQKDQLRQKTSTELSLLREKDWAVIDGEPCRVLAFTPFSSIKEGNVLTNKIYPHAVLTLECKKLQDTTIKGYIWHKKDFRHLWEVFKVRTVKENEEVIICWTKQHRRIRWFRCFRGFPRLRVDIYRKGYLEFLANPEDWQPESGERPSAEEMLTPILRLKWKGMEQDSIR